jgi:hypothetical protein
VNYQDDIGIEFMFDKSGMHSDGRQHQLQQQQPEGGRTSGHRATTAVPVKIEEVEIVEEEVRRRCLFH